MLPLSGSSVESLATILSSSATSRDRSSATNDLFSSADDDYRQFRRVRNMAIASQQRQNPNQYLTHQENSQSMSQTVSERHRPRLSRFWRTVRLLQLGFRQRNQTAGYVQQINSPDSFDRRPTTTVSLRRIEENESSFQRADLLAAEPVLPELPTTGPIVPPPVFISLVSRDQDDEPETTPVTGQTLRKFSPR